MKKIPIILFVITVLNPIFSNDNQQSLVQSAQIVKDAFNGYKTAEHLTPALLDIARNGHSLPAQHQNFLQALGFDFSKKLVVLGRPDNLTDTFESPSGYFLLHYATDGVNAVSSDDLDGNSISDYVEQVAEIYEAVYDLLINTMEYVPPPSDIDAGGSSQYDIYIYQLPSSYYGITYSEEVRGDNENSPSVEEYNSLTSYMAIRNNYEGFPLPELAALQVTIAHEFFHAIQFGYDGWEQTWLMEATAVWMEEANFDDINDCYQYMVNWFQVPEESLDKLSSHMYGSYIFFKYIDEHLGGFETIRKIWEYSRLFDGFDRDFSRDIIDSALVNQSTNFSHALNNMCLANKIFSNDTNAGIYSYEEASGYQAYLHHQSSESIELKIQDSLQFIKGSNDTIVSTNLKKFGSQYFKINSDNPIKIELTNLSGPQEDLQLHAIRKTPSGDILIETGPKIDISDLDSVNWCYIVVVAQDDMGTNWDYELVFTEGSENSITEELEKALITDGFAINNAYPNPFNASIKFDVQVEVEQKIRINIYDLIGNLIKNVHDGDLSSGLHGFNWNGKDSKNQPVSSNIYFIAVEGNKHQQWKKISLIK
ncbi:MXAN_6640 family putative metalloprotease [Candidatus Neomarinimicrobiota bacterium]